ncbi:hypothetical protein C8J57DRAFT_1515394 [Mycena rebaudengoi]|nr:hypothetical protein C8J57DRAFT_1515394 [Mycena rebaudengoi]
MPDMAKTPVPVYEEDALGAGWSALHASSMGTVFLSISLSLATPRNALHASGIDAPLDHRQISLPAAISRSDRAQRE